MTPVFLTSTYAQEGAGRAQGLRVLAHAEPDALRARGEPRGARGRRLGPGLRAGVAASTTVLALLDAGDHVVAGDDLYGGIVPPVRQGVPAPRPRASPTSTRRDPAAVAARHRAAHAPRAGSRRRPTRCCSSSTSAPSRGSARARGVLVVRRQHLHDAVLPAAARARRRPRRALDDEVPERPLRRRRRRGHRPRPGAARPARVPAERDGRQPAGLRQLPRPARHQDAARAHGPPRGERAARSRAGSRHGPRSSG